MVFTQLRSCVGCTFQVFADARTYDTPRLSMTHLQSHKNT